MGMKRFTRFGNRRMIACLLGTLVCSPATFLPASAEDTNKGAPPDLWVNGAGWNHLGKTNAERVYADMIPVPGSPKPVTFDPAHPYYPNHVDGHDSTFRFADISNPNLTQWAKDGLSKSNNMILSGFSMFNRTARCWEPGVPVLDLSPGTTYFIQTPKEVIIFWQHDSISRHIYMNVPHSKNPQPSWNGESVGHYEGDTLVVDTIGVTTKAFSDNYRTPHSDQFHLIERFRPYNDGKNLELEMDFSDPVAFVQPWKAIHRYQINTERSAEFGIADETLCADGELNNPINVSNAKNLEPIPIDFGGHETRLLGGY
jgi:hypothetical protein